MAEICGFFALRMLRSRTLFIDNGSRERDALATFGLSSERAIRLAGTDGATARRFADLALTNGIADAYDHRETLTL